jgi:hypothetical protein
MAGLIIYFALAYRTVLKVNLNYAYMLYYYRQQVQEQRTRGEAVFILMMLFGKKK